MPSAKVTAYPWRLISGKAPLSTIAAGTGATLMVPADNEAVMLRGERLPLPLKSRQDNSLDGECLVNCWLPGAKQQSDRHYRSGEAERNFDFHIHGYVPKIAKATNQADGEPQSEDLALLTFIEELVRNSQHLRWKAEELSKASDCAWRWLGRKHPCLPLSWSQMLAVLSFGDEPRMELVVRFVNDVGHRLLKLADRPRQVLRRRRNMEHLGRVQQIDSSCLTWLVRQPGRNATEKAGSRQEIMAIVRTETVDTLENRTLKNLLQRAIISAKSWIKTNRKSHSEKDVFKAVSRFVRKAEQALATGPLAEVSSLNAIPTPNYVLRHDRDYRQVWIWYLRFVQQQSDLDSVWVWQERLWSETVALFLATSLCSLSQDGYDLNFLLPQAVWVGERPEQGRWLRDTCWPGPLLLQRPGLGSTCSAVMVAVNQLNEDASFEGLNLRQWAGQSKAEYLLMLKNVGEEKAAKLIAIWTLLPLQTITEADMTVHCRDAAQCLEALSKDAQINLQIEGLIVASGQCNTGQYEVGLAREGSNSIVVNGAIAPANLIADANEFMELIRMFLDDALGDIHAG